MTMLITGDMLLCVFSGMLFVTTVHEVNVNQQALRLVFITLAGVNLLIGWAVLALSALAPIWQACVWLEIIVAAFAAVGYFAGLLKHLRSAAPHAATNAA